MPILFLYHITARPAAEAARAAGEYRPSAFDEEGFIHCSYLRQVLQVANTFYRGRTDLVLLKIDPAMLACAVIDENLEGGGELFPHIYGPLPWGAVAATYPFPNEADGSFNLPRSLMPSIDN